MPAKDAVSWDCRALASGSILSRMRSTGFAGATIARVLDRIGSASQYDKAGECLIKDRDVLLAFYDFPARHWTHLRTTNPIETSFATVRHRAVRSKGCLSNKTARATIFKLAEAAEKLASPGRPGRSHFETGSVARRGRPHPNLLF